MLFKLSIFILLLLSIYSCKSFQNFTGINKKTCLVLSVGGGKGLAHLVQSMLIDKFSNTRFQSALNDYFNDINSEQTIIPFATSYQIQEGEGLSLKIVNTGNLAHNISKSANNPFIFTDSTLDKIDPGADRISSVPIEDACKFFNPSMIIAINVTGTSPEWTKNMKCPVKVINIKFKDSINMEVAIKLAGKDFNYIYKQGYNRTLDKL